MLTHKRIIGLWLGLVLGGNALAELTVVSVYPAPDAVTAPLTAQIKVTFNQPVLRSSVTTHSFWAFGRWSGTVEGGFGFSDEDRVVTLQPGRPFSAGETVMVILSHDLRAAADNSPLRAAGFSFQFWTKVRSAAMEFARIDSMTTRTIASQTTRAYGGVCTDLDRDGWLDLTIVNEDTADLRVFMNRGNGTGLYHPFTQPPFAVGNRASPSEPSDFNRDGIADICVANINVNSVSILLGNGDGTFAPQQLVMVASTPRGICVLDADGDGDVDIVNTNSSSNILSLLRNNGNGVFGAPMFFEGGVSGEWAIAAAEMTGDGILDLVVASGNFHRVVVDRGNGDGTFTPLVSQNSGGATWMLAVGDWDRNGTNDVAAANSSTNNAAVLLGNGSGGLAAPQTYATDAFPLAIDAGDVDGDGFLDFVTSSYDGDWRLFRNDGDGTFTFAREFDSPQAASCALILDFDNDGDLDLALIDELQDVVELHKNSGTTPPGDTDCDGSINLFDIQAFVLALTNPSQYDATYPDCSISSADIDGDGSVNQFDIQGFVELLGG